MRAARDACATIPRASSLLRTVLTRPPSEIYFSGCPSRLLESIRCERFLYPRPSRLRFLAPRPLLNLRFLQAGLSIGEWGEDAKGTKVFSFHRKTRVAHEDTSWQLFTPLSHGVTLKPAEPKRSIVSLLPADNGS